MDELCDTLEYLTPLHDPYEAYEELKFSSSISLVELANSRFLMESFARFQKYMKYLEESFKEYKDGVLIALINNFLRFRYEDNNITLAIKCVNIDKHILEMLG